jgi:DNA-binding NarL/FixJ family response regulator
METQHRVLIAEDHPIFREGLRALLPANLGFEIVAEVEDGIDAVRCVEELMPDLVLMDLSMPRMSGIEAIREIRKLSAEIKILALTVHTDEEYIVAAFDAGADGYVLKDAKRAEVVAAIEAVMLGKPYLSPGISGMVIKGFLKGARAPQAGAPDSPLTQREIEVLKLIAEGCSNKTVAERLFISVKTVERHRANLMAKLDLHSPQALTSYALEKRLISR